METHKDLLVWQKSMDLVTIIYKITQDFPDTEKFGLVNQIRRSAVSIPSNMAEGYARKSNPDFHRFLRIAYGSTSELETQVIISKNLNFISETDFVNIDVLLTEVRKMLNKLMSKLADTKS